MLTGIRVLAARCCVPSMAGSGAGAGRSVCALCCVSQNCQHGNAAQAVPKGTSQRGCEQGELQDGPQPRDAVEGASHPTASKTVKKSIWTTWNCGHSAIQVQKLNPRRTLWEERGDLSNFTPRDE